CTGRNSHSQLSLCHNNMRFYILIVLISAVQCERNVRASTLLSSFEHMVQENREASLIWNFTNKYNILENKDNLLSSHSYHYTCQSELNYHKELLVPYVLNLTLNNVSDFIHSVSISSLHGTRLSYSQDLVDNFTKISQDEQVYNTILEEFTPKLEELKEKELFCFRNSTCACFSSESLQKYSDERQNFNKRAKLILNYILFGSKIDPPIRIIVVLIGLLLNCALLIAFVKETSMRKESNICVFNLIINNMILLLVYTPLQYVHKYHHYNNFIEYSFHIFEIFVISVNVFIVLIVSAQRYFDVSRALKPNVTGFKLSATVRCIIYSCFIWIPSIVITASICSQSNHHMIHGLQTILFFLIYLLVLAILIIVFNSLSARKLQKAIENRQISLENESITSSTVVLAITATYYLIFTLFFLYLPFETYQSEMYFHYFFSLKRRIYSLIFHSMISLYPSITILALYKSNSMFRKYLRKYLFRCWLENGEEKYVTMSSLKNDEP
ncbi:hypothetical protein L9F63_021616, partial [Diploptera punctata]